MNSDEKRLSTAKSWTFHTNKATEARHAWQRMSKKALRDSQVHPLHSFCAHFFPRIFLGKRKMSLIHTEGKKTCKRQFRHRGREKKNYREPKNTSWVVHFLIGKWQRNFLTNLQIDNICRGVVNFRSSGESFRGKWSRIHILFELWKST